MLARPASPRLLAPLALALLFLDLGCDASFQQPPVVIDTTSEPKKPAPTASTKVKKMAPTR